MAKRTWREKFETWAIVSVIAVLVWLYAEGENVHTFNNERVQVQFVPPPGEEIAITPEGQLTVLVSFRGSSGQRQRFQNLTSQGPIEIEVDPPPPNQNVAERTIDLGDRLSGSRLGEIGLNLTAAEPDRVDVTVESMSTVPMPVRVDPGSVDLSPSTTIVPAEVAVSMPTLLAEGVRDRGEMLTARLDQAIELQSLEVSQSYNVSAPVQLPADLRNEQHVEIDPATKTVQVNFTIRKMTDTYTVPTMPVRINAQPRVLDNYRIELAEDDQLVREVTLTGPSDVIRQIARGEIDVWAELRISSEQAESGVNSALLYISLPPGVTLASQQPRVGVEITPR